MTNYKITEEIYNENDEVVKIDERFVEDFEEAISIYDCSIEMAIQNNETRVVSWCVVDEKYSAVMASATINPSRVIRI